MNWISNVVRPKIRSFLNRRESPENLWIKCPETGQLVFYKDVEANQFVIPGSNYHMRMSATARLKSMFDGETWFDIAVPRGAGRSAQVPRRAPLHRPPQGRAHQDRHQRRDQARLRPARRPAGRDRACRISTSWAARSAWRRARRSSRGSRPRSSKGTPFIMFAASGGARMQEGILSLMQLPRTTVAVQMLREARQALHRRAHQSDHRRRHRVLRHARRRAHRRARRADRLRRSARDRADHPREAAGGLPARRISARSTAWSTWSCTATSCARRSPNLCRLLTKAPADGAGEPLRRRSPRCRKATIWRRRRARERHRARSA